MPFVIRLSVHIEPMQSDNVDMNTNNVVDNIIKSIDAHNNSTTFELIFMNNIKGCLINVLGAYFYQ